MNRGLVLTIIGLVVLVVGVRIYMSADKRGGDVAGKPIAAVTVPDISGIAAEGEDLFNTRCAECHGQNAAGNEGKGPPLVHIVYEPNHHSDEAIYRAVEQGTRQHHWPFGDMPPVDGLTLNDIAKIIEYIRTLQRANGIS